MSYKITFLGTGTSQGVPVIACHCEVCVSTDPRDNRLRSSVKIEVQDKVFIIDTGPDFRQQMLRSKTSAITAILFTHEHKDHVAGLDDVRAFNYVMKKKIDVFAEERVEDALRREFDYVFSGKKYPGIPEIVINRITNSLFNIEDIVITPIRLFHHMLPIFGFRMGNFAYLTDIKTVSEEEKNKLKNLDVLVISCLRKEPHISHMNLSEVLTLVKELKPAKTYLTHISHRFGKHETELPLLPEGIDMAYDGLEIWV